MGPASCATQWTRIPEALRFVPIDNKKLRTSTVSPSYTCTVAVSDDLIDVQNAGTVEGT